VAIGEELNDIGLQTTNVNLGLAYYTVGDYRAAVRCLRRTVAALGDRFGGERFGWAGVPAVTARAYLVACLGEIGQFDEGIALGEEAVRIAEEANHAFSIGQAYINLGVLYIRRGSLDRALATLQQGAAMGGVSKVSALSIGFATALGYAYARSGRLGEALPLLEDGVRQAAANRISGRQSLWMAWLADTHQMAGRLGEARDLLERALALARDHGERGTEAHVLRLLADVAAQAGPVGVKDVEATYHQVLALADELGMRPLVADTHVALARWFRAAGRHAEAGPLLDAAIERLQEMNMEAALTRARAELSGRAG
jgi:tetratricopeptide (TPR) repeat protein